MRAHDIVKQDFIDLVTNMLINDCCLTFMLLTNFESNHQKGPCKFNNDFKNHSVAARAAFFCQSSYALDQTRAARAVSAPPRRAAKLRGGGQI